MVRWHSRLCQLRRGELCRLGIQTRFTGRALNTTSWSPYITDDPSNGWLWDMQTNVAEHRIPRCQCCCVLKIMSER